MKKAVWVFQILYYVLFMLVYLAFYSFAWWVLNMSGNIGLGTIMAYTYAVLFVGTPVVIAVLMRFSLLKWYIDPIAAAMIPLFFYVGMIITNINRHGNDLSKAFASVNISLCNDGGEGIFFLLGLFVFGLLASFSIARKKGKSISFRALRLANE